MGKFLDKKDIKALSSFSYVSHWIIEGTVWTNASTLKKGNIC